MTFETDNLQLCKTNYSLFNLLLRFSVMVIIPWRNYYHKQHYDSTPTSFTFIINCSVPGIVVFSLTPVFIGAFCNCSFFMKYTNPHNELHGCSERPAIRFS